MNAFSFARFVGLLVRALEISLVVALAFRWFVFYGGSYSAAVDNAVNAAATFSFLTVAVLIAVSVGLLVKRQPRSGVTALRTLIYIIVFLLTPFRLARVAQNSAPRPDPTMPASAQATAWQGSELRSSERRV